MRGEYTAGVKRIIDGAYLLPLGMANAVLLEAEGELALVDAGFPGKASVVLDAIRGLGREPRDLRHLVFTHGHPDHIGSAAEIVRATGATTWMHPLDAPFAESGGPFRPMTPSPSLIPGLVYRIAWRPEERMEPFAIDRPIAADETIPVAGGLRAIATPGHCAGQLAFLWRGERLLVAGDVGTNLLGLDDPVGFEDLEAGRLSQRRVAALRFEAAAFGHGAAIRSGASERFRRKWGTV